MQIVTKKISELKLAEKNVRLHGDRQIKEYIRSVEMFGQIRPLVIDENNVVICGNGLLQAFQQMGKGTAECYIVRNLTKNQKKKLMLADNKIYELGSTDTSAFSDIDIPGYDAELLKVLTASVAEATDLINGYGTFSEEKVGDDLNDADKEKSAHIRGNLQKKFFFPPFSVLDTRKKEWQERKMFWIKTVGIKSSETRENMQTLGALSGSTPRYYDYKETCEKKLGCKLTNKEFEQNYLQEYLPKDSIISSTSSGGMLSIFDPVLCELMYYWFCPEGGNILDPFAGGNVRGLVATLLNHNYTGVDIRQEQIDANIKSAEQILNGEILPQWVCGNSVEINSLVAGTYDMVFSCPPYFDLEKYSDNPDDISNMEYEEFLKRYRDIIKKTTAMLKENRFAVFVVGDVRNPKTGMFRNFVSETISAFKAAGLNLYNEMILINQAGSLPIRASKNFQVRKIGKMHQNILVFYKGNNQKDIPNTFKEIEIFVPDMEDNS